MSTVRTPRTRFSGVANRTRNSAAASRIAAGRSPRGQVALASSNSPNDLSPIVSGLVSGTSTIAIGGLLGSLRAGPRTVAPLRLRARRGRDLDRLAALLPVRLRGGRRVAQVPLGVEGAHTAGSGRGHGLTVGVVDEVAHGEHAGELRAGRPGLGQNVAVLVGGDLVGDEL